MQYHLGNNLYTLITFYQLRIVQKTVVSLFREVYSKERLHRYRWVGKNNCLRQIGFPPVYIKVARLKLKQ